MPLTVLDHQRIYENATPQMATEWREMLECYDYVAGQQYTGDEREYLTDMGRVVRTFNLILSQIVTIDGYNTNNPLGLVAIPREPGDKQKAEVITDVLRYALDEARSTNALRKVLTDALIARRGRLYVSWEPTERYPDGQLKWVRSNPFDWIDDLNDPDPDLNAGNFKIFHRWYQADRIAQLVADGDPELREEIIRRAGRVLGDERVDKQKKAFWSFIQGTVSWINRNLGRDSAKNVHENLRTGQGTVDQYTDLTLGMFLLIELHYIVHEMRKYILDSATGDMIPIPAELQNDREFIGQTLQSLGLAESSIIERVIPERRISISAPGLMPDTILSDAAYDVQGLGWKLFTIESYDYDVRKTHRRGLVDNVRDAQDLINRRMSTTDDLITRRLNPDYIAAEGSITEDQMPQWKSRKMGKVKFWNSTVTPQPPVMETLPGLESMLQSDMSVNIDLLQKVGMVSPNLQGLKDTANESGSLYESRVRQSEVMITPILENLKAQVVAAGEMSLALIQKHMVYPRWVRIRNRGGEAEFKMRINEYDPLTEEVVNDVTQGRYDMILDPRSQSKVEREARFMKLAQLVGSSPPMLADFWRGQMLDQSDFGNADTLMDGWRLYIMQTYGAELLLVLDGKMTLDQYFAMKQELSAIQQQGAAAIAGMATPEGVPVDQSGRAGIGAAATQNTSPMEV